jgi:hypothetical protein
MAGVLAVKSIVFGGVTVAVYSLGQVWCSSAPARAGAFSRASMVVMRGSPVCSVMARACCQRRCALQAWADRMKAWPLSMSAVVS